jgi:orotate phosphoribosyltransferase
MDLSMRGIIAKTGAVLEGDYFFALKSGKISTKYINIDPLLTYPGLVRSIGGELIKPFLRECDAIVGPAVGGIPFVYAAATALMIHDMKRDIRTAFAEKLPDGSFVFDRMEFSRAVLGRRVVAVEDITTSGGSVGAVVDLARAAGATVIGVSTIWNRGPATAERLRIPQFHVLVNEPVETWEAPAHPRWGELPLVSDVGHPEHFPNYGGGTIRLLAA